MGRPRSGCVLAVTVAAVLAITAAGCNSDESGNGGAPDADPEPNLTFVNDVDWNGFGVGMQDGNDYATLFLGQICVDDEGATEPATITKVEPTYSSSPDLQVSDYTIATFSQYRLAVAEQKRISDLPTYDDTTAEVGGLCSERIENDMPGFIVEVANTGETDAFLSGLTLTYDKGRRTVQSNTVIALCKTRDHCSAPSADFRGEYTGRGDE